MPIQVRKRNFWWTFYWLACALFVGGWFTASAQQAKSDKSLGSETHARQVARGKYLVEDVAMCGTCHTPRDESGYLEKSHWLDGAALWLLPARQNMDWPLKAPRIAGSPSASDEQMVTLLTTGVWKDGTRLRAPMPQFRMNKEDAEAVVAYLRSLTPSAEE